jgi:hypothetical protein
VAAYRCSALTNDQNEALLPRVRELTLGVGPATAKEAQKILFATCLFAKDMEHLDGTLDDHLCEKNVAHWSRNIDRAANDGTKNHYLRWINCVLRARNGLPAHLKGTGRKPTAGLPYQRALVGAAVASLDGTPAAAAIVAGVSFGVIPPMSAGAHLEKIDGEIVLMMADGSTRPRLPQRPAVSDSLCGHVLDKAAWTAARAGFAAHGESLTAPRLRLTFAVPALRLDLPAALVIRTFGLGYAVVDAATRHLEGVLPEPALVLQRGPVTG